MDDTQVTGGEAPSANTPLPASNEPSLIKTPEELHAEQGKKSIMTKKTALIIGSVVLVVVMAAIIFFLKSGDQLQGNLSNITEESDLSPAALQQLAFCPVNKYFFKEDGVQFTMDDCADIPVTDCEIVGKIKSDLAKYHIDPSTLDEPWWKTACILSASAQKDGRDGVCIQLKKQVEVDIQNDNIEKAYNDNIRMIESIACNPQYKACQKTIAKAVAAQEYVRYAESKGKTADMIKRQLEINAQKFYENTECINIKETCEKITGANEKLPLSLLSEGAADSVNPVISVEYILQKTEDAIERNNIYTDKEFYSQYCATPETASGGTNAPVLTTAEAPTTEESTDQPVKKKIKRQ